MSDDFLGDRKKALENEFFAKVNHQLLEKLKVQEQQQAAREALAEASNIRDETLLDHLVRLDIGPDTWTALSLVPLVEVAWADGKLDAKERAAILEAASRTGVREGKPSYELLESWLESRPQAALLEVWAEYVVGIADSLDDAGRASLRSEILGGATKVAEAAGGILGFGNKVSEEEQTVIDRLSKAFDRA